ncbi:MAG: nucleotide exchange factor GrpE [Paracoccaceae bacterium]|nr:nucleotide exchange factor GrpE [Paracoccaceae bacterium]
MSEEPEKKTRDEDPEAAGQAEAGPVETAKPAAGNGADAASKPEDGASVAGAKKIDVSDLPDIEEVMSDPSGAAEEAIDAFAQLEAERDALKDKLLRALAETENLRRRADRDRKDAETYGGTRLARDLLAVHDNLDRALAHVDDGIRDAATGFIEGVDLTQRELLNAFAKHKIEKVSPAIGEKFDPNRHQAMFEAPIPGATPGAVVEVVQAGFTIAERLLRPALVGVARAAAEAPPAEEPADAPADEAEESPQATSEE